jgi:formylglycine-generating enzyme required for sulfatase activity
VPKIFISYRREDSKHAVGRLHAALKRHVRDPKRDIFIDIDNIPKGVDFVEHLDQQVAQCDVMLAVIGPSWLNAKDANTNRRRLDDPADFVRIEVASALKRGIPVVPVVLDDTEIPSAQSLPDDLQALARRNGERLEHESFDADVERLIRGLPATTLKPKSRPPTIPKAPSQPRPPLQRKRWLGVVGSLAVLAMAAGGTWAWFANPGGWRGIDGVRADQAVPDSGASTPDNAVSATPSASDTKSAAQPGAQFTPAKGTCDDVTAIVYFDFDKTSVTTNARGVLESALRKTFACIVDRVKVEAHEDLGGEAAYARKLSERRAASVAAVLESAGIESSKIDRIGLGDTRPLKIGVASPLNRRVEVTLTLSPPPVVAPTSVGQVPRAVETFRDCSDCPQMVRIPAGSFMMGSPAGEVGRLDDEGPQRRVTVPTFAAGQFEVTWNEYNACVAAGGCAAVDADRFGGGTRPVWGVLWDDAVAYTKWLSNKTGKTYRLLSEAEWEYAARAGTTTPFSFGSTISASQANYNGNSAYGSGSKSEHRKKTTPVGSFFANAFGLFDMHGNVAEWVQDCFTYDYSEGQPSDGRAFGGDSCTNRMIRGGHWNSSPQGLRSASRDAYMHDGGGSFGFRIARTL